MLPKLLKCFQQEETKHGLKFSFAQLPHFADDCLTCLQYDLTLSTIIFNTFVWCQIFNQYTCRSISNDVYIFKDLAKNPIFIFVSLFTMIAQFFLVQFGGNFVGTTPLNLMQWAVTVAIGFVGLLVGILMRFIPVEEDPNSFFDSSFNSIYSASDETTQLQDHYKSRDLKA